MSFSILKTNVGLTTNTKVMIDSGNRMFLESIDSNVALSGLSYKKYEFNKDSLYDETLSLFANKIPSDIFFDVKYDSDNSNMGTTFHGQIDDLYHMGARNIYNNKGYSEEYEYFAPLYVSGDLPSNFIIFRVDGPGNINLDKDNFLVEIVNNMKVVKSFDMNRSSVFGDWMYKNYVDNDYRIVNSLNVDFRDGYFSTISGIDVYGGGYVTKSLMTSDVLSSENTFHGMNSYLYDLYSSNSIAFPNILNISFLFDDTPSTPLAVNKWSLNRYMGFYFDDLELFKRVTVYRPIELVSGITVLDNNVLSHPGFDTPFIDANLASIYYIEIDGIYSQVVKFDDVVGYGIVNVDGDVIIQNNSIKTIAKWRIVSDKSYVGKTNADFNKNVITISQDGVINGVSTVMESLDFATADLWLIDIDSNLLKLNMDSSGTLYINSDYAFTTTSNGLNLSSGGGNITIDVDMRLGGNSPKTFKIYRCNFSDIKSIDNSILNTKYADFEYEIAESLVRTDESKIYYTDYASTSNPPEMDEFTINNVMVNIPVSSEFVGNSEIFQIENGDLSTLWRKNPKWVKWGYDNSIGCHDYPHLLNNSIIGEEFNRCVNVYSELPDRSDRNLDYFYTIMSEERSKIYDGHSLHINHDFDLEKYLNMGGYSGDYFTYYFGKSVEYKFGSVSTNKWSSFNNGDGVTPDNSVFRGMKFNIYDVRSIIMDGYGITDMNLVPSVSHGEYKLSILFSNNDKVLDKTGLMDTPAECEWVPITVYEHGINYNRGDVVNHYGTLWNCAPTVGNIIFESDPNINPANSDQWVLGSGISNSTNSNFYGVWTPLYSVNPAIGDIVFYDGEYRQLASLDSDVIDFWNPLSAFEYADGSIVYRLGKLYRYNINNVVVSMAVAEPGNSPVWEDYVLTIGDVEKWKTIPVWQPNTSYVINSCVVNDRILYKLSRTDLDNSEPGYNNLVWTKIHSFEIDNNYLYEMGYIVQMNSGYYISGANGSTVDNYITIYINNKWKNVFINITSSDGVLKNISDVVRDNLYSYEYGKLTANNFIEVVNNLNKTNGFSESIRYVVINENGSYDYYDGNNIHKIPTYLSIDKPDQFYTLIGSLEYNNIQLNMNKFSISKQLDKSNVSSYEKLNWYNGGIGLATNINKRTSESNLVSGYHGLNNVVYNSMFRHSGVYSPIFQKIELFETNINKSGNYKFDTTLVNFGMVRELVISKVNRKNNILKLRNAKDTQSIYPMIDEFGYSVMDLFIFKSNWDTQYYLEVVPTTTTNKINN